MPAFGYLKKTLFFYFIMFILLLLSFEVILQVGRYFYFDIHSSIGTPKVEESDFRILFLGESTTAGAFIDNPEENAYPSQVERILQRHYPDKGIRGYNGGISTIETTAILRNFDRNMVMYNPHLVVLMVGNNDYFLKVTKYPGLNVFI